MQRLLHQSRMLHNLLEEAKVNSTLIIVPGAGHGFKDAKDRQRPIDFFANQFLN